jgi:hypothetical protein
MWRQNTFTTLSTFSVTSQFRLPKFMPQITWPCVYSCPTRVPKWGAHATQITFNSLLWIHFSVHFRGGVNTSQHIQFFYGGGGVVSQPPNPQARGPPSVGCPLLLIQYIRSYPPYLETVSSIRNPRTCHAVVTRDPLNIEPVAGSCEYGDEPAGSGATELGS